MNFKKSLSFSLLLLFLVGCSSSYYKTMEQFGIEKRDIMVDRVEDARDAQEESKETFADALEAFTSVTDYDGGNLERVYNRLNDAFQESEESAEEVSRRIDSVERVANDLFDEWEDELSEYSSDELRRESKQTLKETERNYEKMISKMRAAEKTMYPVLDLFRDQVLYLKHNLNARAIASLDKEVTAIESRVADLISEMEASIAEADEFIATMQ
ncbi:MAG: DUF2959 domain-containing protein [Puniceicoccales bacterium]